MDRLRCSLLSLLERFPLCLQFQLSRRELMRRGHRLSVYGHDGVGGIGSGKHARPTHDHRVDFEFMIFRVKEVEAALPGFPAMCDTDYPPIR